MGYVQDGPSGLFTMCMVRGWWPSGAGESVRLKRPMRPKPPFGDFLRQFATG